MKNFSQKIRNEYAKLQKENNELKILKLFSKYASKIVSKTILHKTNKKRKHYYYDEHEESEESDSYITEIRRRPKKQKERIIYEDEIDGIPLSLIHQPTITRRTRRRR